MRTQKILICVIMLLIAGHVWGAEKKGEVKPNPHSIVPEDSAAWKRDPFLGSAKKKSSSASDKKISAMSPLKGGVKLGTADLDVMLQGILRVGGKYHALINGRVVKQGDEIGGVTIREINRYTVTALDGNKETVVYDIYQGRIDRGKK